MTKTFNFIFKHLAVAALAITLFLDLLPFDLNTAYAAQRFILAATLLLACIFVVTALVSEGDSRSFVQITPVLLLSSCFLLCSVPFISNPFVWVEPVMYACFFGGFVLVGNFAGSSAQKYCWVVFLVYGSTAAAALYGLTSIMVYLFALSDGVTNLSAFIPWGFVNIRYWSHIATWLIPLFALAGLIGPLRGHGLWKVTCALAASLWWWIVLLSTARGTMLGVAVGVIVAVLFIGRPTLPWLKMFLKYLAYGVFAWLFLSVLIPSLLSDEASVRSLKLDSSGRLVMFVEAWRMSIENFPFGLGPQSWLTHEILTEDYLRSSKFGHPHNMYLMWAAEYGWLLIGALSILVCQAILLFWQRRTEIRVYGKNDQALVLAAFTASVSAALLHAGVSAVFMAPGSMLIGFLVLCVFWALISPQRKIGSKRSKPRWLVASATALVLGVMSFFWLREVVVYHQAMVTDRESRYETVPYGTPPRFWYYGDFPRRRDP